MVLDYVFSKPASIAILLTIAIVCLEFYLQRNTRTKSEKDIIGFDTIICQLFPICSSTIFRGNGRKWKIVWLYLSEIPFWSYHPGNLHLLPVWHRQLICSRFRHLYWREYCLLGFLGSLWRQDLPVVQYRCTSHTIVQSERQVQIQIHDRCHLYERAINKKRKVVLVLQYVVWF